MVIDPEDWLYGLPMEQRVGVDNTLLDTDAKYRWCDFFRGESRKESKGHIGVWDDICIALSEVFDEASGLYRWMPGVMWDHGIRNFNYEAFFDEVSIAFEELLDE